jgi:hypothetical protein
MGFDINDKNCQSQSSAQEFGICDIQDGSAAYIDEENENDWICICNNPDNIQCTFTAIDNCIDVFKEDGNMERRCDGVLNYSNNIIFIELKSVRTGGWIKDGVEQLEITVERYFSDKNIRDYGKKRAVLANSKRPFFHYGQQSRMEDFRMKTGVRLIINSKILIR